jgi:hypothetical protein
VTEFLEQVWAWILDLWLLLLLIAAVAAVVFTKPTKRRPDDTDPYRPGRGPPVLGNTHEVGSVRPRA